MGPTTTRALASALAGHGWTTVAPDLRDSLSSPLTYAAAATRAAANVDVLVGHSGAGAMLPVIAHDVDATLTVFVDAIVPEATTTFTASDRLVALLDQLPIVDGRLPPWHEWWPAEILTRLVPDRRLREALTAENPRLSRAFYDEPVPLPELWWKRRAGFLQLSPAYDDDRARAEQWGWPTHAHRWATPRPPQPTRRRRRRSGEPDRDNASTERVAAVEDTAGRDRAGSVH